MTDVLIQIGDGQSKQRMKDVGDGSVAAVICAGNSASASYSDKIVVVGDGSLQKRYRNMGDGSVAEVIFGV